VTVRGEGFEAEKAVSFQVVEAGEEKLPVVAQPLAPTTKGTRDPDLPPSEDRPRTREAMIEWIREQAGKGDLNCTVTLNDGSVVGGELETFNGGPKVLLRSGLAEQPVPVSLDQVARIEFRGLAPWPLLPPAKVQFRDGAWVLGADISSLNQDSLRFSTPYTGDLEAPLGAITDLQPAEVAPGEAAQGPMRVEFLQKRLTEEGFLAVPPPPPVAGPLVPPPAPVVVVAPGQVGRAEIPFQAVPQAPPPDPNLGRLWLTNGDVMLGQPLSITEGSLKFQLQLGPEIQVPLGEVKRITLGPHPGASPPSSPEKWSVQVTLITSEVWMGTLERWDAKGLQLGWFGGQSVLLPLGLLHVLTEFQPGFPGLRQWAVAATASSEYGNPGWGAMQATGPPDTFRDGDYLTAWATRAQDGGPEWLELEYATPVHATRVRVRETYNPGAVVRIEGVAEDGKVLTFWEGRDPTRQSPGWLEARFEPTPTLLSKIRIHLDTALVAGWNEIDAVELIGTP
jgi:hypothetical protein